MRMNFNYLEDFSKDLKKLKKKIPSLEGDLKNFEKFIPAVDFEKNKRFIILTANPKKGVRVIKTRLMVRSLKGSGKTRLIFSFCIRENSIDFIEIYMKNEKSREDSQRIKYYMDSL
jgi:mRNA-degrading endonuclease RelE of RelBE toxin-antitoxin system